MQQYQGPGYFYLLILASSILWTLVFIFPFLVVVLFSYVLLLHMLKTQHYIVVIIFSFTDAFYLPYVLHP